MTIALMLLQLYFLMAHKRLEFKLFSLSNKSERNRTFSHQHELVIHKNFKKFHSTPENLLQHTIVPWHTV